MSRTKHHGNKAKERAFGAAWRWMTTPGSWTRLMMTKPQRQEVRSKVQKLHKLADVEDAPEFPLAKKPHIYYW